MARDRTGGSDRAEIDDVDAYPKWKATGPHEIRARNLSSRHLKLLNNFQVDIGDHGRREGIAALLEFYNENPDKVVNAVAEEQFR